MNLREKIHNVIQDLTLDEKLTFTAGIDTWHMGGCERIGIAPIKVSDGPNGVRGATRDHVSITPSLCIPCAMGLGASFDEELLREGGRILAVQAKEKGISVLLAPTLNLARHLLWGRCFETFSEDPTHAGYLGAAFIAGVQSENVIATAKHYVGNESETERYNASSEIDEQTLREIYLLPFEYAVKKGKVASVMTGYPRLNGAFVPDQPHYLGEILRKEWGFDGFVISDWYANFNAQSSFKAGLDVEMPGPARYFSSNLKDQIMDGSLSEEVLDQKVFHIIFSLSRVGIVDIERIDDLLRQRSLSKESTATTKNASSDTPLMEEHPVDRVEDREIQYKLAASAVVLLENKSLLPLSKNDISSLAIMGLRSDYLSIMGGGSAGVVTHQEYSFVELMRKSLPNAKVHHCKASLNDAAVASVSDEYISECKHIAQNSQYVLLILGTDNKIESEGYDKKSLYLPGGQDKLATEILEVNKNTVIVVNSGTPYLMSWAKKCPALLQAFFGGMEMPKALCDILLGEADPGGRLPVTVPQRMEDTPAFCNFFPVNGKVDYREGIFMGYRWYEKRAIEPLYPFGYGLSYASFAIEDPAVLLPEPGFMFALSFSVRNISSRRGSACVQAYLKPNNSASPIRLPRPLKELKRFAKVSLDAFQETKRSFSFSKRDFAYYDPGDAEWESLKAQNSPFLYSHGGELPEVSHREKPGWYVDSGEYEICIGFSSADIVYSHKVLVERDEFLPPDIGLDFDQEIVE